MHCNVRKQTRFNRNKMNRNFNGNFNGNKRKQQTAESLRIKKLGLILNFHDKSVLLKLFR